MFNPQLITYSIIVGLLTLTPGADTMLVLRNVFSSGKRAGIITTIGICSGLLVYAALTSLGISVILTKSVFLFQTLKLLGAGYLVYLGVQSLLPIIKSSNKQINLESNYKKFKRTDKRAFIEGFLSNLFNPKIAVFYLTFLPQFINPQNNILIQSFFLTGIHVVMGLLWLSFLSVFISSIRFIYTSSKIQHILEAISGTVMIIFGILLLLERK